jgi:hypothetical protein
MLRELLVPQGSVTAAVSAMKPSFQALPMGCGAMSRSPAEVTCTPWQAWQMTGKQTGRPASMSCAPISAKLRARPR